MTIPDIESVRQNWHQRGFSCDLWIDPPDQRWEGYVHNTDELVMVVEGMVEFEVDGVIQHPSPPRKNCSSALGLCIPFATLGKLKSVGCMCMQGE
jgi:hypothetical protein